MHALPTSSHAQASFLQAPDNIVDDSTDAQIHAAPFAAQAWAAKVASSERRGPLLRVQSGDMAGGR